MEVFFKDAWTGGSFCCHKLAKNLADLLVCSFGGWQVFKSQCLKFRMTGQINWVGKNVTVDWLKKKECLFQLHQFYVKPVVARV